MNAREFWTPARVTDAIMSVPPCERTHKMVEIDKERSAIASNPRPVLVEFVREQLKARGFTSAAQDCKDTNAAEYAEWVAASFLNSDRWPCDLEGDDAFTYWQCIAASRRLEMNA